MTDHPETLPATAPSTTELAAALGRMHMLPGEDAQVFRDLRADVIAEVQPQGIIEHILVNEFVCQHWQALRWRRSQTNLLDLATERTRERLGIPRKPGTSSGVVGSDNLILGETAVAMSGAFASMLNQKLSLLERLDALLSAADGRRGSALRDLHRHRKALARREQHPIEEAEFRTVEHGEKAS